VGAAGVPWDMECGEFISQMSTWGGSSRGRARLTLRCAGASLLCEAACVASDLDDALLHPHRRNCYAPVGTPVWVCRALARFHVACACVRTGTAREDFALWSLPICCHRVPSWFVLLRLSSRFRYHNGNANGDFPLPEDTRNHTPNAAPARPSTVPRMSSKPTLRRAPCSMGGGPIG